MLAGGGPDGRQLVRPARHSEAPQAVAILREAALWSGRFGESIWDPDSFEIEQYVRLASIGELVGGFDEAGMAAIMLLQDVDPVVWSDDPPKQAVYLHKIAVRRRAAGRGWLPTMIDYAAIMARRAGASWIRLDTVPLPRMIDLYRELGFALVDDEPREFGGRVLVRLERRA